MLTRTQTWACAGRPRASPCPTVRARGRLRARPAARAASMRRNPRPAGPKRPRAAGLGRGGVDWPIVPAAARGADVRARLCGSLRAARPACHPRRQMFYLYGLRPPPPPPQTQHAPPATRFLLRTPACPAPNPCPPARRQPVSFSRCPPPPPLSLSSSRASWQAHTGGECARKCVCARAPAAAVRARR